MDLQSTACKTLENVENNGKDLHEQDVHLLEIYGDFLTLCEDFAANIKNQSSRTEKTKRVIVT